MKIKINKNVVAIILLSLYPAYTLVNLVYDGFGYAYAVAMEAQENQKRAKLFVYNLAFSGKIMQKVDNVVRKEDDTYKYSLAIRLNHASVQPGFGGCIIGWYYYSFTGDTVLNINVPQAVYVNAREQGSVSKKMGSCNLIINNRELAYINGGDDEWLAR